MEFFRIKKDIPFMRHALVFNIISLITFVLAVTFLITRGLSFSIEFTGGTLLELRYQQAPDLEKIRSALSAIGFPDNQVQNFGTSRDVLVRLPLKRAENEDNTRIARQSEVVLAEVTKTPAAGEAPECAAMHTLFRDLAQVASTQERPRDRMDELTKQREALKGRCTEVTRVEFVGPQVGRELAENGALALLLVVIGIMAYLAIRFEWRFALSAVIANLHDVVIILGFFAFFQWEFSLPVLAAVLAVLGYSVNESVVVFDRVRETFRKKRGMSTPEVLNHAITSTMSRTVITHASTQAMVTSMLLFGGPALFYFALALTIGILFGIYSSIFVGSPLVMWLGVKREHFIKPKKQDTDGAVV